MVVTRRTPVVPPQQLARNPSFRGTQRASRSPLANDTADVLRNGSSSAATASFTSSPSGDNDHRNGLDDSTEQRSRRSRRRGKNKHQKSNFQAFLDFLTKLLLLAFTIYTFSVCPQDTHQQSPICRGLTEYKRIVLDPYIIPPIQALLVHPSVAPHIERVTPYVHRAAEITTPILVRTQQEWNLHVVPVWEKRIVPEWNKYVVPQWDKHVAPRIQLVQSEVEPYRLRVMREYDQRISPRVHVAFYNFQRWQRLAEPYIFLVASKTKEGYYAAKPYTVPLAKKSGRLLQRFALFLREQRQKFVDPHVAKIWDKVKELSSGQVVREVTPEHGSSVPTSETPFTVQEILEYTTAAASTRSSTPAYGVIPTPLEGDVSDELPLVSADETTEDEPQPISVEPAFTSEPEPESVTSKQLARAPTGAESHLSAEFVLAETTHESASPPSDASGFEEPDAINIPVLFATGTASPSVVPSATDRPTESPPLVTASKIVISAASATIPPANSRAEDEIDLDAFYAELGLDEPLGNLVGTEEYNSGSPSSPTESEEERVERLRLKAEETARKRADIEARQAKWETELETQMERSTSQLQSRLTELRAAAAAELATSAEVRNSIDQLVHEAEKYIRGAEIYLKNLKGESRRPDEKLALWDRVANRVNDKFHERLLATESVINAWYKGTLDKELQEVATVSAKVRETAEKGQLDLGLDYAWLEDVTYNDWQRYHALIGTSERYADEAASIQNGTHPNVAAANAMTAILADLESEVQDVVIGFETRVRRIKRDGERAFNNHGNGIAQKEEEKGSNAEPDPEVSTLPVPHGEQGPFIIRRSREEVLEALGKVEPAEEERVLSGSNVEAKEAVTRLVREMEGGAGVDHTEL